MSGVSFSLSGLMMVAQNAVAIIAEYERLRYEADQLDKWGEQVEARLVELERILPDDYIFALDSIPRPLTLSQRIIFLKQVVSAARVGPWKLCPGLGQIVMSLEWTKLFATARPPATFPEYLKLIDADDRQRIAAETNSVFLMGDANHWQSTFSRAGRLILARAIAISPGHIIGVDIDITVYDRTNGKGHVF